MNTHETPAAPPAGVEVPGQAPATRPGLVAWSGLALVLIAAAVLSFDALRGLAVAVRIPGYLAPLLPVAVDAGAAVSCAAWLGRGSNPDAARFACRMTWALLLVTVAGNAGQLGMHAHGVTPPWWVAVAVGAVPPAIVGACVHLAVLAGRSGADPGAAHEHHLGLLEAKTSVTDQGADNTSVQPEPETTPTNGNGAHDPLGRVRAIVAAGGGRGTVAAELDVTPAQARTLIEKAKATT